MKERILELIKYKTGGKQRLFADIMGWSPQYLAKLIKNDGIGIQPIMSLLKTFPDISSRWLLLGEGPMIDDYKLLNVQSRTFGYVQSLVNYARYIPVMTADELEVIERGFSVSFTEEQLSAMELRLQERNKFLDDKFADAMAKSNELCKELHMTTKK